MKIKEAIMEMPVKKAAVLAACSIIFLMFVVQSLFVNQVFSIINRTITGFERIAKDDARELDKDLRETNEQMAYDAQMTAHNTDYLNLSILATPQEKGCYHVKNIKRFEAMQSMAFVKHYDAASRSVEYELGQSRKAIKEGIEKHEFDPALCKEVVL